MGTFLVSTEEWHGDAAFYVAAGNATEVSHMVFAAFWVPIAFLDRIMCIIYPSLQFYNTVWHTDVYTCFRLKCALIPFQGLLGVKTFAGH